MDLITALKSLDHYLFFTLNGLAGREALLDAFGIFTAKGLIWVMGLAAFWLLYRVPRVPLITTIIPPHRRWFFPSGAPRALHTVFIDGKRTLCGGWACAAAAVAGGLGWGARMLLARVFGRTRPYLYEGVHNLFTKGAADYAFPSGHTTIAFALAFSIQFFAPRYGALFLFCALMVGLGRIFIGAHYPADVAAGAVLGYLSAVIARWVVTKAMHLKTNNKSQIQISNVK
ncbi:MAG: phosphatase PAP2 family protein [Patescibacteria group bacterium]